MSLAKQLYKASMLAMSIESTGVMNCTSSENKDNREAAKFESNICSAVGGVNNINAGLTGIINVDGKNALVMAFRGTNGTVYDWLNNLTCAFVDYKNHGRVHKGFFESVQSIFSQMIKFATVCTKKEAVDKFYLTGHSKGGAMASLMAAMLADTEIPNAPKPEVVTFASPRVGDIAFVKSYPAQLTRYECCRDIVPHVPLTAQEGAFINTMELKIYRSGEASADDNTKKIIEILHSLMQNNLAQFAPLGKLISIIPDGEPQTLNESTNETVNTFYNVLTHYVLKGKISQIGDSHTKDYRNYFN